MANTPKRGSKENRRIRDRREHLQFTQKSIAEKLRITITHYAAIESGRKDFSKDLHVRMANVLNVSADYSLFGNWDTNICGSILVGINIIPKQKRHDIYRIIKELLGALAIE